MPNGIFTKADSAKSKMSTSQSLPSPPFDAASSEARLNALAGMAEVDSSADEVETPELQDQFLADTSLNYLGSRSTAVGDDGEPFDTLVEYHRIDFQANQTRAILHLRFRPDFSLAPAVEATLIDTSGRVRVTSSTIFGARIEITLSNSSPKPTAVCIETICTNCPNE